MRISHHVDEIMPMTNHGTIEKRQPQEVAWASGTATAVDKAANEPMMVM